MRRRTAGWVESSGDGTLTHPVIHAEKLQPGQASLIPHGLENMLNAKVNQFIFK